MPETYVGITIGPISDLLENVSKPAGLWGGSYLFSWAARRICERLLQSGVKREDFLSPYLEAEEKGGQPTVKQELPGIGLFHDRVIFKKAETTGVTLAREVFQEVRKEIDQGLRQPKTSIGGGTSAATGKDPGFSEFVNHFFQFYAVEEKIADGESPIGVLSRLLDAYELQHAFPESASNPILALLDNKNLKESFLAEDCGKDNCPVLEPGPHGQPVVRGLQSIAQANNLPAAAMKKFEYIAIVYADGDSMGSLFGRLTDTAEIAALSRVCQKFAVEAARRIRAYGGVPIYAGGDDLLFLAPIENAGGAALPDEQDAQFAPEWDANGRTTVFHLLASLKDCFIRHTGKTAEPILTRLKNQNPPTLSFGALLMFYKYPLYEGLRQAQELLESVKKNVPGKNATKVRLLKHSGQVAECLLPGGMDTLGDKTGELVRGLFRTTPNKADARGNETFLKSVSVKLANFRALFHLALKDSNPTALSNAFRQYV